MIEYWDLIVSDYQRQYNKDLYDVHRNMSEEHFFILYAGLNPSDSAFLQHMVDKYKDVIKANQTPQKPQYTKEIDNPRDFMMALNNRSRK